MPVLETRTRDGIKYRRYQHADGRRTSTAEVPLTVIRAIGKTKLRQYMAAWERGENTRIRAAAVRAAVARGDKPTAIAHEFGLTDQRVRQVRKEMNHA